MRSDVKIGLTTVALVLCGLGYWYYAINAGHTPPEAIIALEPGEPVAPPAPTATPILVAIARMTPTPLPILEPTAVPTAPPMPVATPAVAEPTLPPIAPLPTPTSAGAVVVVAAETPTPTAAVVAINPTGPYEPAVHFSEPGEKLGAIAARFGVPLDWIHKANPRLPATQALRPGTRVLVPDREPPAGPVARVTPVHDQLPTPAAGSRPAVGSSYTVVSGDSLWAVAKKVYGAATPQRVAKLKEANATLLRGGDDLKVGMVLTIPAE